MSELMSAFWEGVPEGPVLRPGRSAAKPGVVRPFLPRLLSFTPSLRSGTDGYGIGGFGRWAQFGALLAP